VKIRLLYILMLLGSVLSAQPPEGVKYKIKGKNLSLGISYDAAKLDSVLESIGFTRDLMDSLVKVNNCQYVSESGWEFIGTFDSVCVFNKPLNKLAGRNSSGIELFVVDNDKSNRFEYETRAFTNRTFFANSFESKHRQPVKGNTFTVWLPGHKNVRHVYLSGTFNNWSMQSNPLHLTDSGWVGTINLKPGVYAYKFIKDGDWMTDPLNKHIELDPSGYTNSVMAVPNHTFELSGYDAYKNVNLAGTFTEWDEVPMDKTPWGWKKDVYLKEGVYSYKFVGDGSWFLDPANSHTQTTHDGYVNSVLMKGEALMLKLDGHQDAGEVLVAGDFNNWAWGELKMQKQDWGWELPYIFSEGNYQLGFRVDGRFRLSSYYPLIKGKNTNNLLTVHPNHTFLLKGYADSKQVTLTGSFINWSEPGIYMQRTADGWKLDMYMPKGKHLYKFIVNKRTWILDPEGLWEENEYGTGNSILWME